ncbi:hypothetical protein QE152_g7386 [Popillia japonica]|uniref:Uncharacterized protein n=1 Tax=Popillia japonica TaxID=7064 RepID=A0AAW1MGE1_POPJA
MALINEKENRIKISEKNIERLQSRLYDVAILVREGPWHVLCTNANCAKGDIYGRDGKACCPNCIALSISWCWTIDPMWSKCTICGCSKTHHELLQIPNFEEKTKRKNLKIETEEEQRAGYNDEKLKLMVTRGKLIGEEARIKHDMLEEISYLKRDGLHVFNKETIELFDIEISVCRDEERTNRLRNYLKRYQELYDLYQNSKNNNE